MSRRVVITGLGTVSAFGVGAEPTWQAILEGRSAINVIRRFNPCGFTCKMAAEVDAADLNIRKIVPKSYRKATKVMCRDIELAVVAAAAAVGDAGLVTRAVDPDSEPTIAPTRVGCHIGAGLVAADVDELTAALWTSRRDDGSFDMGHWGRSGMENLTPLWLLKYLPNMLACHVTIIHDCQGPSNTITCCESSSGLSIGESIRVIQRGAADCCLTGGAESKLNPMAFLRQQFAGRLAPTIDDEDPTSIARPFDAAARGTIVGEGGGILVLEALDVAAGRGVTPYAELVGFASTQSHCPDTVGLEIEPGGIADAIEQAVAEAGGPEIDAIVPLGSSIPQIDRAEAAAIKQFFGAAGGRIPLITTIPNLGNCQAGAGAISVAVAACALKAQTLPARLNTTSADGLDAAACGSRAAELNHVLVFQTSQGGQNAAMVLRRIDGGTSRLRPRVPRVSAPRAKADARADGRPRVVITGMGWVTPLGHDLDTVWSKLIRGTSGVTPIDRFDAGTFPTSFAAQVRDYDYRKYLRDPALHRHAAANTRFALGSARQAWEQASLAGYDDLDHRRVGIYLGAGEGVLDFDSYARVDVSAWDPDLGKVDTQRWAAAACELMDPLREIGQEPNMPLSHIAREYDIRGPAYNCLTACAASTQAIGEAVDVLRRGDADVMISGGTHTMIHVLGVTGFTRLTALSRAKGDISRASRPFDRKRSGFVMGEGSGIVVLETLTHARARGAPPLAEIVGYGSSADAFRITDMHAEGRGPSAAIREALNDAGLDPLSVDSDGRPPVHYISAHGTGTLENDSVETLALKRVFGPNAPRIPVSSIKSMMGHLIAAAGVVELITCVLAIRNHVLPPTSNLTDPDPELDLDYVPNTARRAKVDVCLSDSFGFGGQNDTLIVKRFEE